MVSGMISLIAVVCGIPMLCGIIVVVIVIVVIRNRRAKREAA